MRRWLSLIVLAVLVVLAVVVSTQYLSPKSRRPRGVASAAVSSDSLAKLDSTAREGSRQEVDTMCFASRIGLPCDQQR
jgi:hypothetical protein